MSEIITFSTESIAPARAAVFENQGIPPDAVVSSDIENMLLAARGLFLDTAKAVCILAEVSGSDFEYVYAGEGRNEPRTPVGDIFSRADHLMLFALTLGEGVCREIEQRFQSNDFALACMLDSVASTAADRMVREAESSCKKLLSSKGCTTPATRVLSYSPGYCGWHISGQKRLFEFMNPQQIGISLRESFLMEPLKSVSGVMICGPVGIHDFPDTYHYCMECETHDCRQRIRALLEQ